MPKMHMGQIHIFSDSENAFLFFYYTLSSRVHVHDELMGAENAFQIQNEISYFTHTDEWQ